MKTPTIVFFGTSKFATIVLDEMKRAALVPVLIVTVPDAPRGRHLELSPSEVKVWAEREGIAVLTPQTLKNDTEIAPLLNSEWDLFVVASYGKILPKDIIDAPRYGTLNVHPSLLPELRGASPIQTAILRDMRETGVSIMQVDEELDHGPVLAQARIELEKEDWPPRAEIFEEILAHAGGELLSETIPEWIAGAITPEPQDDSRATYCEKIEKEMGEINLTDDPYQNLLKIRAYTPWPGTYFFIERNGKRIRVKIVDATLAEDGSLTILRVIPEGKKEMSYEDYLRGSTS